jgi:hypothetical protein
MLDEAFNLGVALACVSNDMPVGQFTKCAAVAARMQQPDAVPAKRLVIKAAHDVMAFCGEANTAPAHHLRLVANLPGWSAHAEDVYSSVVKSCSIAAMMEKRAFNEAVEGMGSLAKGIGYAGLAAGGGLGSLYWLMSRHATQDEADIEAKKQQRDYYRQLNNELQASLRRKYRYQA